MGKADIQTKEYMSNPAHFADALNYAIYGGRKVVQEGELTPMDTTEVAIPFGSEGREHTQRHRDVLKLWQTMRDDRAVYAILGVENQTDVHYAMPARNMLYDAMSYATQITQRRRTSTKTGGEYLSGFGKADTLMPVVTIVIHFGTDEWDGPTSVHDMFGEHDKELLALTADYKINLIEPSKISDGDFRKFSTGLGLVLGYIKYAKDDDGLTRFVENERGYEAVDTESADLINVITDSELSLEGGEGKVNMCQAIKDMRRKSYEQGERDAEERMAQSIKDSYEQGGRDSVLKTLASLVADGFITQEIAADRAGMSIEEFQARLSRLNKEQAD